MTLRLRIGAATHMGLVRDANEDAYHVDEPVGLVVVADGMGGHRGGEVASATALDALRMALADGKDLSAAIVDANRAVFEKASGDAALAGMGTTLTAGTLVEDTFVIGHVGDSRAYLARDGELVRVTADHSLVAELVRAGELTEEEAETDPRRSMITRALGVDPDVEVDVYPVELHPRDRLLVCSDGLTVMLGEDQIATLLAEEPDPQAAAARLVAAANDAGGADNVTVVVADVVDDADSDTGDDSTSPDSPGPGVEPVRRRWWSRRRDTA